MSFKEPGILFGTCLALATGFWFGFGQGDNPGQGNSQSIQVRVDMVSIPVVVATRDGRRVADLEKKDFEVYEDKVPQQIAGFAATDEPISVVLLLDTSGSMQKKLARLQNEAIRFVNTLHPDDSVAIMSFADDVNLLEDFSIDRKRNEYGIKETRSNGGTALFEGVWLALQEVLKPVRERKALVLFTDGVDTASRKASESETLQLAKETQATIYCIYFNTEGDIDYRSPGTVGGMPLPMPRVRVGPGAQAPGSSSSDYYKGRLYLSQLAEYSGGVLFNALTTEDLGPAFDGIAKELASQYSIGYYPTNAKHDGKFRKIEVRVRRPDLVTRTKKGYYAPKDTATKTPRR
jgi:Ca-activated chloride channel family protein